MPTRLDIQVADRFHREAALRFPDEVLEVRIFGSRARGTPRLDSDLDLFVRTRGDDRLVRNALVDLAWDVSYDLELPYPVVVHVMSDERFNGLLRRERRLALDIVREGVAV